MEQGGGNFNCWRPLALQTLILKEPAKQASRGCRPERGLMVLPAMRSIVWRRRWRASSPQGSPSPQGDKLEGIPVPPDMAGIEMPADHQRRRVGKAGEQLPPRDGGPRRIGIGGR